MKTLAEISLCNACVNACPYCVSKGTIQVAFSKERQAEGGGVYLNPDTLMDFAEQMMDAHPEGLVIALTGGEPMCHPAFEAILEKLASAKRRGNSKVVLYSNLKLLTESRIKHVNGCVDYLVAGYHPGQNPFCKNRKFHDERTRADFGEHAHTSKEWLKEQLDKLDVDYTVNYVVGAYGESLEDFELWALGSRTNYVKTPMNRKLDLEGIHLQTKNAPDMLAVRADGTIIKCNGKPDVVGSIYETRYAREMLCRANCPLCPSYYCYFGFEHLFMDGGN